jgi:hypothetical protein
MAAQNEFSSAFSTAFDPAPQQHDLATPDDVAARLGRPLTPAEQAAVDGLIDEASALVIGYLGCDPSDPGPVPASVTVVVSRMVARALQQAEAASTPTGGEQAVTNTVGPFSQTRQFFAGSTSGQPWLSASDKIALRPYRCDGKAYSVDTAPRGGTCHADICSANRYRNYPPWYAGWCTCGANIAGEPIYEPDGADA